MIRAAAAIPMMQRGNKYKAKGEWVGGTWFASRKEVARYRALLLMQRAGAIHSLDVHPSWDLKVNGHKIGRFTADFRYVEDGRGVVIEDVKSKVTAKGEAYRLRKKVFEAIYYPLKITEIIT